MAEGKSPTFQQKVDWLKKHKYLWNDYDPKGGWDDKNNARITSNVENAMREAKLYSRKTHKPVAVEQLLNHIFLRGHIKK